MKLSTFIILAVGIVIGLSIASHSKKAVSLWHEFEESKIMPIIEKLRGGLKAKIQKELGSEVNSADGILKEFCSPISGDWIVTSPFGWRYLLGKREFHKGIDLVSQGDDGVYAAFDGILIYKGRQKGYGNIVILKHSGDITTKYAHLNSFASGLSKGEIKQHQELGRIGKTGRTNGGKHLHYEIIEGEKPINPRPYLREW